MRKSGILILAFLALPTIQALSAEFTIGSPVSPTKHNDPITITNSSGWYAHFTVQRVDAIIYLNYGWDYTVTQYDHNITINYPSETLIGRVFHLDMDGYRKGSMVKLKINYSSSSHPGHLFWDESTNYLLTGESGLVPELNHWGMVSLIILTSISLFFTLKRRHSV